MLSGQLLARVSSDNPCGINLEYDNDFVELETLFRGSEESQIGDSVIEAQEPDWHALAAKCEALLQKSKDLNLMVYHCVASLKLKGFTGLASSVQFLQEMIVRYWEQLYPLLDMNEPENQRYIERLNILESLSKPYKSFGDDFKVIERLRETVICSSKQAGAFAPAHIIAARENTALPDGSPAPTLALVRASFQSSDPELLQAHIEAVKTILVAIDAIDTFLVQTVGAQNSINFKLFKNEIERVGQILHEFAPSAAAAESPSASEAGEPQPAVSKDIPVNGAIQNREGVIQAINRILEYYPKHEPGSPVPLLLSRAKRLVNLDFMELIGDLAPASKNELQNVFGARSEETPVSDSSESSEESSW